MKLQNTTDWPDYFLRRMVSWCCKELGYPVRNIKRINFRNKSHNSFSGHCHHWNGGCRIVCSISKSPGAESTLVNLTAHEIRHAVANLHKERTRGNGRRIASSEKVTCHDAGIVEAAFKAKESELIAAWSKPPAKRVTQPKLSITEQRAEAAQKKLAEWTRKERLAKTKRQKYAKQVRYYERAGVLAATHGQRK